MGRKPNPPASDVVVVTVDGRRFETTIGEINGRVARQVRAKTGMSVARAVSTLSTDPDLDVLATLAFAGALQSDPLANFDEIEALFTYQSSFEVEVVGGGDDSGEV